MKIFISIAALCFFAQSASAIGIFGGAGYSRSGNSESTRWTLGGWMQQKEKFRLQDQWLALNKQRNFFEFTVSGGQSSYESTTNGVTSKEDLTQISAQMWISIFGLQYVRADSSEDFTSQSGQFNVRLFGTSTGSTHLTAHYGVRKTEYESPKNEIENQFAGIDTSIYLVDFFGISGGYQQTFDAKDTLGTSREGERIEYGAFFDIAFLRISATFFEDTTKLRPSSGASSEVKRDGLLTGIQFYL